MMSVKLSKGKQEKLKYEKPMSKARVGLFQITDCKKSKIILARDKDKQNTESHTVYKRVRRHVQQGECQK